MRTADLGRLVAAGADVDAVLSGYGEVSPLDREEELAVPLLGLAARLEGLAMELAVWADGAELGPAPLESVDLATAEVAQRLDELGVPEETGVPPRGARSRSS